MADRGEIRYLELHKRVRGLCARERLRIRRSLLCCGVLLAVSEDKADDELERVGIPTEKTRPQSSEGVLQHFLGVALKV